jgi:hypothetical protein
MALPDDAPASGLAVDDELREDVEGRHPRDRGAVRPVPTVIARMAMCRLRSSISAKPTG